MIRDAEDLKVMLLYLILTLWLGWFIGWVHAHQTVASECRKLGAFYVGKTVYKCVAVEPAQDGE